MFIGIDGTGPVSDAKYSASMENSFVHRLWRMHSGPNKRYLRGPETLGLTTRSIVDSAMESIREFRGRNDRRLFLSGYSRGGLVAINVAKRLEEEFGPDDIEVVCLALFDAVDRQVGLAGETIPGNVRYACHAVRDSRAGSRSYFGHCGLRSARGPEALEVHPFFGTHAALGGLPWEGDHPVHVRVTGVGVAEAVGGIALAAMGVANPLAVQQSIPLFQAAAANLSEPDITKQEDEAASAAVWAWISAKARARGMLG